MLTIARRLAEANPVYEDMVVKFVEQYLMIVDAIEDTGLYDAEDGWFYDRLEGPEGATPIRVQTLVGRDPAAAGRGPADVATRRPPADSGTASTASSPRAWKRPARSPGTSASHAAGDRVMLSVVGPEELRRALASLFDEAAFLSPHGLRSLSKRHAVPYEIPGHPEATIGYEPGEGRTAMYGGNSNWRGPVWMPLNVLITPALVRYHRFLGDEFTVEYPTGSGGSGPSPTSPRTSATGSSRSGCRARTAAARSSGTDELLQTDPAWQGLLWFPEYFHGDTGAGLGAMHQTGWTAEVINLLLAPPGGLQALT